MDIQTNSIQEQRTKRSQELQNSTENISSQTHSAPLILTFSTVVKTQNFGPIFIQFTFQSSNSCWSYILCNMFAMHNAGGALLLKVSTALQVLSKQCYLHNMYYIYDICYIYYPTIYIRVIHFTFTFKFHRLLWISHAQYPPDPCLNFKTAVILRITSRVAENG